VPISEELRPRAFAVAYRMLGSVSEAEDIVQEALLRLHHPAAASLYQSARRRSSCSGRSSGNTELGRLLVTICILTDNRRSGSRACWCYAAL
jgi:hypothetical protein